PMGVIERQRNGGDKSRRFLWPRPVRFQPITKRAALDEFRDDKDCAVFRATDIMSRYDVLMVEPSDRPRFGQIGFHVFRLMKPLRRGYLDSDLPAQSFVKSPIHTAKATRAH